MELILTLLSYVNSMLMILVLAFFLFQFSSGNKYNISRLMVFLSLLILQLAQILFDFEYSGIIIFILLVYVFITMLKSDRVVKSESNTKEIIVPDYELIAKAKEAERSRIYANLHDDVGAKLLELIYSIEDEQKRNIAKDVLSRIRTAVASTTNIVCSIKQLQQEIENESEIRLELSSIKLESIVQIEDDISLKSHIPPVIIRILREIISNIIKHAGAKLCEMTFNSTPDKLEIRVKDDGIGMHGRKEGKGLKTIQKRADKIGANVGWNSGDKAGSEFIFTLIHNEKNTDN